MEHRQFLTFDRYRLDLPNEQLWQGNQLIPLPSKALSVLRYLVEHAGQLVTKAELFAALWSDTVVSDGALTFCIVELRKALGDNAKVPRFIETVHRRGYRFIASLSTPPEQSTAPPEIEQRLDREAEKKVARKLAALLSADVQGYSRLMRQDELGTLRTLTAYRTFMTELIVQYGGQVVDAPGDNLLAEFASAVAAVQCAVAIQQALSAKNAALSSERQMAFCMGLNVGDVLVEGEQLYGDGVNIAARLEGLAEGGGLCISGTVYDQIKGKVGLSYEYLGAQAVKNIAEPVRVYRVRWEAEEGTAPALVPLPAGGRKEESEHGRGSTEEGAKIAFAFPPLNTHHRAPVLVGRDSDLTQLHQWLVKALHGERQLVFVTGEPGIGKTTLVDAFLQTLDARSQTLDAHVWRAWGQCIEQYGPGEPYMPILEALGRLCRNPGGEQLVTLLQQYAPTWLVQMPALLKATELEVLQRKTQGATRERMLREMGEALDAITAERPLVLVLEDLHWSDASTLELLNVLARRHEPARLLVIGTYRPVDVIVQEHPLRTVKQELQLHGLCIELPLGLLGEQQVAEYLTSRLQVPSPASAGEGQGEGLSAAVLRNFARLIHQRTDGNPLFMVTAVDDLVSQGVLITGDNQRTLPEDLGTVEMRVPDNVQQLIERQLEQLSAEERRILEVASVAGMEFSAAAVAASMGTETESVEERCEGLAHQEHFLRANGIADWPDGTIAARYSFLHALYQEVLYARIPAGRRQRLHQRIGERQETAYGKRAREIAAALAVHFEQGRDYPKAIYYLLRAGRNALQRSAHQEAITHFTKGLQLLTKIPDSHQRDLDELRLQVDLGTAFITVKGYGASEVEQACTRAHELSQRVGDPLQLFAVLGGLCSLYLERVELKKSHEVAEQLLRLADTAQDPILLVWAHRALGSVLYHLGEFSLARHHLEQSLALYDPHKHRQYGFAYDPGVTGLHILALVLFHLGYVDQALQRSHEALSLAQALSHPHSLLLGTAVAASINWRRGEQQKALELEETMTKLAIEHGFPQLLVEGTFQKGSRLVTQGQAEPGINQMQQGLATLRARGTELNRPYLLLFLAEAYGKIGQADAGLSVVAEALATVDQSGEFMYTAESYRIKGELTLQQSRVQSLGSGVKKGGKLKVESQKTKAPSTRAEAEAAACFLKAIEISRKQQAKTLELRATMSLARLWQQQALGHGAGGPEQRAGRKKQGACNTQHVIRNKLKEAHQMLSEIYNWFTEGFDTKDLQEAKALLTALDH